jgi:hypothetical protein
MSPLHAIEIVGITLLLQLKSSINLSQVLPLILLLTILALIIHLLLLCLGRPRPVRLLIEGPLPLLTELIPPAPEETPMGEDHTEPALGAGMEPEVGRSQTEVETDVDAGKSMMRTPASTNLEVPPPHCSSSNRPPLPRPLPRFPRLAISPIRTSR